MAIETREVRAQRGVSASRDREQALAALATVQHGVVARQQLLALGFSPDQIQRMLASERLHRLHHGVYAVGHRKLTVRARWMAGVLACEPDALLGHRSAAALRQIRRTSLSYVEVTAPGRHINAGIRTYVCRRLAPQDRDEIDGIPCASVALTLLQLAAVVPRRQLERACDEAEVQRLFDLAAVEDVLARFAGCRGAAQLRAVLDEHEIGTTLTRPGLEERALKMCDRAGIPRPHVNVLLTCRPGVAWEVDFLWRAQRLVLETDGNRFHRTGRQIERDRRKEADLVRAGYRVLRATYWQVEHDARSVTLMLEAALESR
jgi:hypothetical protein